LTVTNLNENEAKNKVLRFWAQNANLLFVWMAQTKVSDETENRAFIEPLLGL